MKSTTRSGPRPVLSFLTFLMPLICLILLTFLGGCGLKGRFTDLLLTEQEPPETRHVILDEKEYILSHVCGLEEFATLVQDSTISSTTIESVHDGSIRGRRLVVVTGESPGLISFGEDGTREIPWSNVRRVKLFVRHSQQMKLRRAGASTLLIPAALALKASSEDSKIQSGEVIGMAAVVGALEVYNLLDSEKKWRDFRVEATVEEAPVPVW